MSRATVRAALQTYFAPPNIAGINTVYRSFPKRIPGSAFRAGQAAGTKTGAAAVVHIVSDQEKRIALGGATSGKKEITYQVELQIYCHSVEPHAEDATDAFDAIVENVKARLRADRTAGTPSVIFQAAETRLEGRYGETKVLGDGSTEKWAAIAFEVLEIINA